MYEFVVETKLKFTTLPSFKTHTLFYCVFRMGVKLGSSQSFRTGQWGAYLQVTAEWRQIQSEGLHNLHTSQILKLRNKTNCETDNGHVARTGVEKCIKYFRWKTMNGGKKFESPTS